jgi:hypothetical protein
MRSYQVLMKEVSNARIVKVQADDVNLDSVGDEDQPTLFWNFLANVDGADVTVAAFPFLDVAYITSEVA